MSISSAKLKTPYYFIDEEKIKFMTEDLFKIKECKLIKYTDMISGKYKSRYQLVFKNN